MLARGDICCNALGMSAKSLGKETSAAPELYDEGVFEEAVVTGLDDRLVTCVVLRGIVLARNGVEDFYSNHAIHQDTNALPSTIDDCEHALDWRATKKADTGLGYHTKYVPRADLVDGLDDLVRLGSVLHLHHVMVTEIATPIYTRKFYDTIYCLKPEPITKAEVERAIEAAYFASDEALRQHVDALHNRERALLKEFKTVQRGEPFKLFEGAELKQHDRFGAYIEVPDRVLTSDNGSIQLIRVRGRPYYARKPEDAGTLFITFSEEHGGHHYAMNDVYPLEEVGEDGLPADFSISRVRLEVTLYNPVRKTSRASAEEQRLTVRVDNDALGAVLNDDRLVGNQGYGGVLFDAFRLAAETEPNYSILSPGAPRLSFIPLGNTVVLPADLELLVSLEAEFPTF